MKKYLVLSLVCLMGSLSAMEYKSYDDDESLLTGSIYLPHEDMSLRYTDGTFYVEDKDVERPIPPHEVSGIPSSVSLGQVQEFCS